MYMLKLVSQDGRWATKDKSMIFCNVVWVSNDDITQNRYILIDDEGNDLKVSLSDHLVNC